jgi:hypothetical protein
MSLSATADSSSSISGDVWSVESLLKDLCIYGSSSLYDSRRFRSSAYHMLALGQATIVGLGSE